MQLAYVLALLSLSTCGLGAVYDQLADLKKDSFDFVIVGGEVSQSLTPSLFKVIVLRRSGWRSACEQTVRDIVFPGFAR